MPGLSGLPIEIQLVFWMLIVFIGALCGLVVFWTKRYLDAQDAKLFSHESKLSKATDKIQDVTDSLRNVGTTVKIEFLDFRREVARSNEDLRKDTYAIKSELALAVISSTAAAQNLDIIQKASANIEADLKEHAQKISALESNQLKIVTTIQKVSEKLIKVGTKKDSD